MELRGNYKQAVANKSVFTTPHRYNLTFFKGYEQNPIMVCNVDVHRLATDRRYPGRLDVVHYRLAKGRQVTG